MTLLLVSCHGGLATALVDTARMIVGDAGDAVPVAFTPGMGPDDLTEAIEAALRSEAADEPVPLILTDLAGGTPARVAATIAAAGRAEVVTGVNLPMLVEVLLADPAQPASQLAAVAVRAGQDGVRDLGQTLRDQGVLP
ncbi:PTS sugar transporter subunit IIA [Plantactinospora sonchi]|uniref:PTS EIIA type-4 domain-containing protein n=1 Tax=Plantactinospora sonchi TaxID=1544735 RepID=A0ABU7S251_9ACTN